MLGLRLSRRRETKRKCRKFHCQPQLGLSRPAPSFPPLSCSVLTLPYPTLPTLRAGPPPPLAVAGPTATFSEKTTSSSRASEDQDSVATPACQQLPAALTQFQLLKQLLLLPSLAGRLQSCDRENGVSLGPSSLTYTASSGEVEYIVQ